MASADTSVTDLSATLSRIRFRGDNEKALQDGIAATLTGHGHHVETEVSIGPGERIDLTVGRVGIETKTRGSSQAVARQLERYARTGMFDHLILVTSIRRHRIELPDRIAGIPITVHVTHPI